MPTGEPSISRAAFEALVTKSGLALTEAQKTELFAAYGYVEAIARRVRASGNRPREVEPALTFNPRSVR